MERQENKIIPDIPEVKVSDFDYLLPEEKIATYPLPQRDRSKLLVFREGDIFSECFCNLPYLLPKDSILVFNDSKVIHARIPFQKETEHE